MGLPLRSIIYNGAPWPPPSEKRRLADLETFKRLFDSSREELKVWARRFRDTPMPDDLLLEYPIPEIAVRTLATFIAGENPKITTALAVKEVDAWAEDNGLYAQLMEAAVTDVLEGEVYGKIDTVPEISDHAVISFISSSNAFPEWQFGRLVRVAFVRKLAKRVAGSTSGGVWRHVEIREREKISHFLYRGTDDNLGDSMSLTLHPETAGLADVFDHGIRHTLAVQIPWWRTTSSRYGISILARKVGLIEALWRLFAQDQHDAEFTRRRIAGAAEYFEKDSSGRPSFDRTRDVIPLQNATGAVGDAGKPLQSIEFADSIIMSDRIDRRIDNLLLAMGIAPQSAGRGEAGNATSGTARRLAQSLTMQTVTAGGRYFAGGVAELANVSVFEVQPKLLKSKKHKRPGGAKAVADIAIELRDGLPDDPVEAAERLKNLRDAGLISIEQGVRELHPDWDDKAVAAEVARIEEEKAAAVPSVMDFAGATPPEEGESDDEGEPDGGNPDDGPPASGGND